jgi:2-polyprenyl-3-methyl-5-hydroxy-6-metoxy-1,4-benzoquinol methylase
MPVSRSAERLRASPNFVLAFTLDGRPYVAKETEPYIQYWLSERYRVLLSAFSRRRGATAAEAIRNYVRLSPGLDTPAERKRCSKAIDDMREAGVLVAGTDDTSRYDAEIVEDYLTYRAFPQRLAEQIIAAAPIGRQSRVLDLAGGPGDLACRLARASDHVSLMELSRGFLDAASARAKRLGVGLTTLHDSCNRLVYRDEPYDVVTVAQALHWLDDVQVCRGLCRVLRPGGSFFVVHGAMEVDDAHPLAFLFGRRSVLGEKPDRPFVDEVRPLLRRLGLLFEALDAPDVQRIDLAQQWDAAAAASRIAPAGVSLFRQRRPFGIGFARGFLTPRHIDAAGRAPAELWRDVEARCAAATPDRLIGTSYWAVLHFRRGGARAEPPALETLTLRELAYEGPADETLPSQKICPIAPPTVNADMRTALAEA